jgi:hypothetical protein
MHNHWEYHDLSLNAVKLSPHRREEPLRAGAAVKGKVLRKPCRR